MSIIEFYKNKNIFITGGSGFVGKCLVEKILRSCTDVGNIYLLLRPKSGKSIQERLDDILNNKLFEVVKKQNPNLISKVIPISGDTTKIDLGLSEENKNLLVDNVNIVIHTAASVRFDDSLKQAILTNVRSTREVAKLSLAAKNLCVLVHTSTTFCNVDQEVVKEILYPSPVHWEDAIKLAEECDSGVLEALTAKYISPFPNTYTFTKLVAENVINDMCVGRIPSVIYRPSIVSPTYREPFPGFVDNFNGVVGLMLGGATGLVRVAHTDKNMLLDFVYVDSTVNSMLVCAWAKAVEQTNKSQLSVYNGSQIESRKIKQELLITQGRSVAMEVPLEKKIWRVNGFMTTCWYEYYVAVLFLHLLPAVIIDLFLMITGKKPMLFKLQRKVYIANSALHNFSFKTWKFQNRKFVALEDKIPENEKAVFQFMRGPDSKEDFQEFMKASVRIGRHLLLNEPLNISPQAYATSKL